MENAEDSDPLTSSSQPGSSGEISMPRGNRKGKGQSREETHPSSTPKLHAHVDDADSNNDETGHSSGASGNDERQGSVNRKGSFEGESDGIMGINKGNRKAKRKGKCELRSVHKYPDDLFTVDSDSNPDITKLDIFTPFHSSSDPKIPPVSGTLEVGDGGFTAVLSADFDLLQLTAPSNSNCGLVFARGNFPDSSVLSRGQRSGFGFGLRIPHDIDYQLNDYLSEGATRGRVRTRDDATSGWLNYRWPVTRELFQREDSADGEVGEVVSAWYVKDGSLIQVSRIARVHSRKENGSANHTPLEVGYKIGSLVRFGCCCTNRAIPTPDAFPPPFKLHLHTSQLEEDEKLLVIDDKDLGATMCVQCFCDEEPLKLQWKPETTGNAHAGIDFGFTGFVTLMDKPIILISMFSLCGFTTAQRKSWNKPPSLEEIEKDLGISSAGMKSGLLWKSDNSARADGFRAARKYDGQELHQLKLNLIGRTVEYILSVAVVPLFNTGNDTQPIAILSNIVSSMRIDVHTFFWQIRALIKVYEYIEPLRNIKKLGVICSKYRLRIQQTLLGAITWVYLCLGRLEEGGEELDSHAEQRWYFVTGKLGILRNGCHRGQAQLVYLKHCVRFLHGNPERSMPQSHSTGYTHWILYWSLTLAYVLQNANTPKLKDYIISQKKLNEKLHQRAQQDGARIETYSLSHSFLRWFTALFFSLARLFDVREDDPNVRTEQIKYEATTRKELQKHWETEKIRRMSEHRPKDLYTALDELNDRMALLVYELHHEPTRELANTLIGDVGRLMLRRKFTTQIKPPRPIDWRFKSEFVNIRIKNSRRMIGEEVHWSPWELSCNNFIIDMHSKCMVVQILAERTGKLGISAKNISEIFDKGCRRFIQRGYSIVTSWDETLPETMSDWWSMETDSLLAVSLVEMLRAAEVLERSSAASGESTSSTSDLESSVDLDEDQFRNAPSARSGGSYSYECSYLSKKIKEDDIRIRLHQTMRQKLSVKIQKGIFNAMVELEKRRLLEPSTDQSATAEKYLSKQEYDSSTDSSISLEELESDIPPVDSTPDPSAVTDSLPPDDASEPGSMREPSAKIPGIYAATNGEESPTMYLALAGTEKTLDKRYPLETDSAGSPYVPEGYHDVDGGPRESESPPGFQRLFKLLIPDHRAFFCNNMYINDADVKPILEWDGKVLIYRNDTLLYDIKPHANGRLVDTPEPPHPPDISKELVLFRKFSSPLTLPTFTPPPKSFAAPTMRSPPALTPEYVHPAELEPSFKKSPEGAPASSDIPNPPAPARTHRRRAPSPSYFAKAYSSAFTRVPSEYTSAPLGYPPDHFGNQSPLRTTQVSPAGPSVLSPQTRGTPGFIDRSKGVRFNPQTRVREFKAPGSETGAGESASDITDSSAAAHTQLPAITSNS